MSALKIYYPNEGESYTDEELIKNTCKQFKQYINQEKISKLRMYSISLENDVFKRWNEDYISSTLPEYHKNDMHFVEKMSEILITLTESINNVIDHVEQDLLNAENGDDIEVELKECETNCGYCDACNDPSLFEGAEILDKMSKENLIDFNIEDEVEHIQVSDKLELSK